MLKLEHQVLLQACRQDEAVKIKSVYSAIERPELRRRLLRVPCAGECKSTLLHLAVQHRAYQTITELRALGASRKVQSGYPQNPVVACYPIHLAASTGDIVAAKLFIKNIDDIVLKDGNGRTVKQVASDHGQSDFVAWLVDEYGSDADDASSS